ncbi:MAG: hypothetical protein BWY21_00326 [Parcubacteria group bacterium ADurb.Bin216]|nr:MAG: hypothetical protein BWY21_00326 [Parcubacteria group bacterium ADurb.Bin216]
MKIYVVQGSTGEYSDHREWILKAFTKEQKAKDFVVACTQEYQRIKSSYEDKYDWPKEKDPHKLDPAFEWDYTGTNYTYFETELEE